MDCLICGVIKSWTGLSDFHFHFHSLLQGFPGGSVVKNLPASAGDARNVGSIPRLKRSPGRGHGNPLQYCCLENLMDRGAWQTRVHGGHKKSDMTEVIEHAHVHSLLQDNSLLLWGWFLWQRINTLYCLLFSHSLRVSFLPFCSNPLWNLSLRSSTVSTSKKYSLSL